MSKLQVIIPTILVIFPRSLALLAADATGELFVVTIICTYSPIMERQGSRFPRSTIPDEKWGPLVV